MDLICSSITETHKQIFYR